MTTRMADAYALTVVAEKIRIIQRVLGLGIIIFLFLTETLNLTTLFLYHYIISIFICIALILIFFKKKHLLFKGLNLSLFQVKRYSREFYNYCHPLFVYALFALVAGIFDRWLLQLYGGSIEQGLFGLGFKIATICFLFSSAMTMLIQREFAVAFKNEDLEKMAYVFRRYIPLMYAIVTYFSCFVSIQSEIVTIIIGGEEFLPAALVVSIIVLVPIHQTYGQLGGSVLLATEKTKLIRNIGVISRFIGIPATYFILAPALNFGLDAGAIGLAVKFVFFQFVVVNVELFFIARFLKLNYFRYFLHQLGCFASIFSLAYFASTAVATLLNQFSMLNKFFISGIFYTALVAVLGLIFPVIFGLTRNHARQFKQIALNKIFRA